MARGEARELYNLHLKAEDYEGAERSLKFMIQQKPADAEPRQWIIDLYSTMGREEPMVEHLRRLAEIYVNAGDVDRAIAAYRELLEYRPEDARARLRYIDLYSQFTTNPSSSTTIFSSPSRTRKAAKFTKPPASTRI
jgi:tetratricopeptide (TPR) repeat protein